MLQLMSAATSSRQVHACEAALGLMGIKPVYSSRTVKYIRSQPRRKAANTVMHGRLFQTPMQLYKQRHASLSLTTFPQYYTDGYLLVRSTSRTRYPASKYKVIGEVGEYMQLQALHPPLVRFTQCNPSTDPEGFAFNILLQHVPFRSEDQGPLMPDGEPNHFLRSPANVSGSYFVECFVRGIWTDEADLATAVEESCIARMYHSAQLFAATERMTQLYEDMGAMLDGSSDDDPRVTAWAATAGCTAEMKDEFADLRSMDLTQEQQGVLLQVATAVGGLHIITGGPGSGKTTSTKRLVDDLRQADIPVRLCASTGAAAVRLSQWAVTAHSAFRLPARGAIGSVPITDELRKAVHQRAVFVIDE